jgi:hypothetical protein
MNEEKNESFNPVKCQLTIVQQTNLEAYTQQGYTYIKAYLKSIDTIKTYSAFGNLFVDLFQLVIKDTPNNGLNTNINSKILK